MALQATAMTRVFIYNGVELPCLGSQMTVDAIRDAYSATFPELTTATIAGPEAKNGKLVYKFERSVGAKG